MFFLAATIISTSTGRSDDNDALTENLADMAKSFIESKNQLLVTGYSNINPEQHPLSSSFKKSVQSDSSKLLKQRESLISDGQEYSDFHTNLTVREKKVSKTKVVLRADEHTVLNLYKSSVDLSAPKTTEYVNEHILTFIKGKDGEWVLSSDELINSLAPVSPAPGEKKIKNIKPTQINEYRYYPQEREAAQGRYAAYAPQLNRSAIVNYAYKYWSSYNPAYIKFSSDCTNFVSQAVRAGGWSLVSGWYRSSSVWWYEDFNQSWTWAGAENWFQFTKQRPRGYIAKYFSDMQPGDILQADWNKDGTIDHSMIVTKKDSSGTIYLTYHSSNTKDKSIKSLLTIYPTTKTAYYGWRLYSSIY